MISSAPLIDGSLAGAAAALTKQNSQPVNNPSLPRMPRIAELVDPVSEVLVADVIASLPRPIADKLLAAETLTSLHAWLAAGEMYRWVCDDPRQAAIFLAELGDDPQRACLALVEAIASGRRRRPRDLATLFIGPALVLLALLPVWLLRGVIVMSAIAHEPPRSGLTDVLIGGSGIPLFSRVSSAEAVPLAGIVILAVSFLVEGMLAVPMADLAWHWPMRNRDLPGRPRWARPLLVGWLIYLNILIGVLFVLYLTPVRHRLAEPSLPEVATGVLLASCAMLLVATLFVYAFAPPDFELFADDC